MEIKRNSRRSFKLLNLCFCFFVFFPKTSVSYHIRGVHRGRQWLFHLGLVWLISNWPFHETACRIFPAFARLAAHFWQIEVLSGARRGQEKLTPISVALTDQVIGLFISALCVVKQCTDWRKPNTDLSTDVLIVYQDVQSHPRYLVEVQRQILFLVLSGCSVSSSTPSKGRACRLSCRLSDPWDR